MAEFIDTHTHITDEAFAGYEDSFIGRALDSGVTKMILPDIDSGERGAMLAAAARHPGILFPMAGLYPGSVGSGWEKELELADAAARAPGIVAMGEIGLDYHFSTEFVREQKKVFKAQLEIAAELDIPVNIHLRDATEDFFKILDECRGLALRGNLHAFSGSAETFRRLSKYGDWYVGIGGVVTFKNAGVAEAVRKIPLERIVLETDAPYLAPSPLRGTRNESSNIPLIAAKIAELKGTDTDTVAEVTTSNSTRLFGI